MEIKIEVTKKNKDKIFKLLGELIDSEIEGSVGIGFGGTEKLSQDNCLSPPINIKNIEFGEPTIAKSSYGAWAMFNSFIPGKASLRILAHMMVENGGKPIRHQHLITNCLEIFEKTGLSKYRGFPNVGKGNTKKESSGSRLEWHLIWPFYETGLIQISEETDKKLVSITKEGMDFACISNPLLDGGSGKSILSNGEKKWLLKYLTKIESTGFKEYSVLSKLTEFLKTGKKKRQDLITWFMNNKEIVESIRKGSRYKNDPKKFSKQLMNLCGTFAAAKIALLREFGVVNDKRGDYTVLESLTGIKECGG